MQNLLAIGQNVEGSTHRRRRITLEREVSPGSDRAEETVTWPARLCIDLSAEAGTCRWQHLQGERPPFLHHRYHHAELLTRDAAWPCDCAHCRLLEPGRH